MRQIWKISLTQGVLTALLGMAFIASFSSTVFADSPENQPSTGNRAQTSPPVFATVGGKTISMQEYHMALQTGLRAKFYHGKPPEGKIAEFQREVGAKLVKRVLLLHEAKRRGLRPDEEGTRKKLEELKTRYSKSPNWGNIRKNVLPGLQDRFNDDSLLKILEEQARGAVMSPDERATRKYFDSHPEKFTEPERVRVSVILLKVDPSSSNDVWEAAKKEGRDIVVRLRAGADFAELAKIHSGDKSSSKGGDMGYLHKGMLAEPVQKAIDTLKAFDISEPLVLLQGIGIFRLDDRKIAKLVSFAKAKERAQGLLQRKLSDKKWNDLLAVLKKNTPIKINESVYLPLPGKEKQKDGKN